MHQLPEGVWEARFDKRKFSSVYTKSRELRSIGIEDEVDFVRWAISPSTVIFECDEGMIFLYDLIPHFSCKLMVSFYDGKLSPRTGLVHEILLWAFVNLDLLRVSIWVPSSFLAFTRWATEKLGFKEDGKIRSHAILRGRPVNYSVLSMLCEEAL